MLPVEPDVDMCQAGKTSGQRYVEHVLANTKRGRHAHKGSPSIRLDVRVLGRCSDQCR